MKVKADRDEASPYAAMLAAQVGDCLDFFWVFNLHRLIQGDFFNWPPPKNHKFKKKIEYTDWPPPKSSKCQPVSNCFLRKS